MDKPTIFFSHSSKDRDLILPIKNKLTDITSGIIDIFMSSDGQSIPFGRNWVSKIEEGLKNAKIMFVFVTPNSIKSEWIYFEAGYAYSKEIEVIPVGIGIHIGELKAPLNLLQGFDILSCDSMNNFISIINKKFLLSFKEGFEESDYAPIYQAVFNDKIEINFWKVFKVGLYKCYSQYPAPSKECDIIRYDVDKFYDDIRDYLNRNEIQHSESNEIFVNNKIRKLLVNGIKIIVSGKEIEPKGGRIDQNHKINFKLSTYNFKESFELFVKLIDIIEDDMVSLKLELNDAYDCVYKEEQLSSIISLTDALFYSENGIDNFKYKENVNWMVEDMYDYCYQRRRNKRALKFSFKKNEANVDVIIDFINCLYKTGVIYEKKC